MFGYHVHEKAILNVIIPFALISFLNQELFFLTLIAGTVSLFPLLFTPFEIVLKAIILVFHISITSTILKVELEWYQKLYVLGFIPIYILENLGFLLIPKLPFLPLLLVSDYTLVGTGICYATLYYQYYTVEQQTTSVTEKQFVSPPTTPTKTLSPKSTPRTMRKRKRV